MWVMAGLDLDLLVKKIKIVKAEKCDFRANTVPFLGLIIQDGSMKADPEKVRAVVEWPILAYLRELQRFLGFSQLLPQVCLGLY